LHAIGPRLDKTRLIRRNVTIAFPEKSVAEIDLLVREIWGNLGAVLAEFPHLETICGRDAVPFFGHDMMTSVTTDRCCPPKRYTMNGFIKIQI